jgi:glycosyltransferase involved in cell wall biosynthesis
MFFSVIVPIYKIEKYLKRCIDSVLSQTCKDFELILVDDGSPDNCGKICDEYAEKDNRIHVIHKENGGLSSARNAGIDWAFANSNSEWITFIDSDDWVYPKYLETLYNAIIETGCSLSVCSFARTEGEDIDVDETVLSPSVYETESFFCEHNVNAIIAVCKLYKKEAFQIVRYPVGKLHEDEFTTYKILFEYENVAFVNQPLYAYYVNNESIMKSQWTPRRMDSIDAISEQVTFFSKKNYSRALDFSVKYLLNNLAKHYRIISENDYPEHIKQYLPELKDKIKTYLRYAHKKDISIISDYVYIYELVYPHRMKIYWYWQAVKRKLKRK